MLVLAWVGLFSPSFRPHLSKTFFIHFSNTMMNGILHLYLLVKYAVSTLHYTSYPLLLSLTATDNMGQEKGDF